jgi:5'-nucleotidase
MVIDKGLPERTILNVNVPSGEPAGAVVTVQGRREHEGTVLEGLDPRRRTYYWIEEGKDRWATDEMSDIHAIRRGLISITPLHNDTTHHAVLQAFRAWEPTLLNGHGSSGKAPKK